MDSILFKSILKGAPDPVFIQSEGKFIWLNKAACRMFGNSSSEELTGKALIDFIHPGYHDDPCKLISPLSKGSAAKKSLPQQKLILKNGNQVWVEYDSQSVTCEGKKGTVVFLRDITQSKEAESNLKSSYTLLRMAGEVARFGGWTVDVPDNIDDLDNQIINWSDAVADIHEAPRGYLHRVKDGMVFYAPGWRERIGQVFKECAENGISFDEEMEIITTKGNRLWIRTTAEAVKENGKIVKVQGSFQDLTIIKRALQKEKETEEKFRTAFSNHSAVKLIIDPENGNIVEVNKAAVRFYGWTSEEMKQMNISQIIAPYDPEIKEETKHLTGLKKSNHIDIRHKKADGEIIDVEVFSSKIYIEGKDYLHSIVHDVTGKIKAEGKLKLLSRSVEQSPVSVVITNLHGNIEYVNPVFRKTTGYSLTEVSGKTLRVLKSGHHSAEFYENLWTTILSGKDWTGELRNKKKNGQIYWEEAIISPILDNRGRVTNFVCISEDITERKLMVDQLIKAKEKAEESDRLKSAFLANMSHEIRTPMNGIMGFAEILKEPGLNRQSQLQFIDKIEKSGRRMLDTVNDLIDIAKIETGQVKIDNSQIDLNQLLEDIYEFFRPQAEQKNLHFIIEYPVSSKSNIIYTDHVKLESILINLIKNAIKFTDKGKIKVGMTPKDNFYEFSVSDTGIGVPLNFQKSIFNRFEQVDMKDAKSFHGSGLGLAISKAYAELLGGEIWVESQQGQGACFYFTILKREAKAEKDREKEREIPGMPLIPQFKGKKILVAEDDLFSLEMLIYMLKKTGATLLISRDGKETIEQFQHGSVDLVLLDIRLPEMDGYQVLKKLRTMDPGILVIAQTAYALVDDIKRLKEAGFTDYLTKPVGKDKMYAVLNKYLH